MIKNLPKLGFIAALLATSVNGFSQNQQIFSTVGPSNFTAPVGVLSVKVECVGGGGAGGRVTPSNWLDSDAAGGGGGGAYASALVNVFAGNVYTVTVGAGGINNGTSVNGGDSYFDNGSIVKAAGGTTRDGNDNVAGVAGGQASASVGTTVFSGGNGGTGDEGDADGGGGGGAAGSTGAGYNGGKITSGAARPNWGGNGGLGGANGSNGQSGGQYGGGGGGSSANGSNDRNGGAGASGVVVINWITLTAVSPTTVCPGSNQVVEIKGKNFGTVSDVTIGGASTAFTQMNDSIININSSSLTSGGTIIVSSDNGSSEFLGSLNFASGTINTSVTGMTIISTYTGSQNVTYQWIDCLNNNTPIAGATTSTYTSAVNGLFAVVINDSGCEITSQCVALGSASIHENMVADLNVYPNPTNDLIHISTASKIEKVEVMSITGSVLSTLNGNVKSVSLNHLSKGLYLIRISTENGVALKKLLLQ